MTGRFIDLVTMEVHGGKGGNGIVSFRREAHVPKGGPNGGDGGDGGSVILVVDRKLSTLSDFRNGSIFKGMKGRPGGSNNKTGARGDDLLLSVPPGTVIFDADTGEELCDLTGEGEKYVAARGGKHGRGNASFATSRVRAPRSATKGAEGESRRIRMELRLLADAGLVGFPNAGKSTILSVVSSARPKVAGYPFTTLHPALGMVNMGRGFSFVLADLPGLIEGASEGMGLGLRFLRHVERTGVLVYVLAPDLEISPIEQFRMVSNEIHTYKPQLEELHRMIVLSKADLLDETEVEEILATLPDTTMVISSATGLGMKEFLASLAGAVNRFRSGVD